MCDYFCGVLARGSLLYCGILAVLMPTAFANDLTSVEFVRHQRVTCMLALLQAEVLMAVQSPDELVQKKCKPCEGGVVPYSAEEASSS